MDGDAMGAGIAGMDAVESLGGGVNVISHGTKTETITTWRGRGEKSQKRYGRQLGLGELFSGFASRQFDL